jgi:uncharacterized protein YqhQ
MSNQHSYGGQAVLEGVLMRGQRQATVVARNPEGQLVGKHFPLDVERRAFWERIPLVRGVVMLWDMLILGTRSLNFSASVATGEQEEPSTGSTIGTLAIALVFAIGLFFLLPLLLATVAAHFGASLLVREVIEGVVRLGIIVGYLFAISRLPDIQRVFAYHGAEHKTVNAYEAGEPLTVANVRSYSVIHPRCGTSFVIVVALISFVVFLGLGGFPFWVRFLSRIVLIPVIAGIAYEVLKLTAAFYHHQWVRLLIAPSLAFQKLTTREPDDQMIATAIAALQAVLQADGVVLCDSTAPDEPLLAVSP